MITITSDQYDLTTMRPPGVSLNALPLPGEIKQPLQIESADTRHFSAATVSSSDKNFLEPSSVSVRGDVRTEQPLVEDLPFEVQVAVVDGRVVYVFEVEGREIKQVPPPAVLVAYEKMMPMERALEGVSVVA